ncbi:histidine kinase [Kitasatospora cheerisanensis KCTC 2395]|uniref:Histidine kinase n=1 Tax=Kitasatospora cheerisanensis KCTC 2395 TaxID=1348663 RepID=A0A066Z0Y8_9ACTN|nr:histidine kinase [Kitasatospora cheerisanensis KCTC 2395]
MDQDEGLPGPVVLSLVLLGAMFGMAAPADGGWWPGPAALLALAVQAVHCLPWTTRLRGAWTLAAQLLLASWSGVPGFAAASVLLLVRCRVRWVLFALVVLGAAALAGDGGFRAANGAGNALAQGLTVFALTRLFHLYAELHAARGRLASAQVAQERQRAARDLHAAIGVPLAAVLRLAANGDAAGVAATARRAAARVRAAPEPPRPSSPPDGPMPAVVLPVLIAAHLGYLAVGVVYLTELGLPALQLTSALAALATVTALQVRHSLPRPPGVRPSGYLATWALQCVLAVAVLFGPDGPHPQLLAFAAASALVLLPPAAGWPAFGAAVLAAGTVSGAAAVDVVTIALVCYGLALLTTLVDRVREARRALAELAVARERRRIARDVHDLLGSGLTAVAVTAELAVREPAAGHLPRAAALAERTLAELRAVPADGAELDLDRELASAEALLSAAGITLRRTGSAESTPAAARPLLAAVLREGVTNVLRHSRATECALDLGPAGLRLTNDRPHPGPHTPGRGTPNLTARAAAHHADLSTAATGPDSWTLTLDLAPLPAARTPRSGATRMP